MQFKNDNIKISFGQKLKRLRKENNVSQATLAKILDVNPATISAYEKGVNLPSLPVAYQIATHFNVSIDWLCGIGVEPFSINTYTDIFNLLVALNENNQLICDFQAGYDKFYSGGVPIKVATVEFIGDSDIYDIFEGFNKMKNNLNDNTIDKDIFDYWIQKHKEKYQDKKIKASDDIVDCLPF